MEKMRHCFNCRAELGVYPDYNKIDTCGKIECHRAATRERRAQRAEAHAKRDMEWD
jgi:hypothetical protein